MLGIGCAAVVCFGWLASLGAPVAHAANAVAPLSTEPIPTPANLAAFIKDNDAAIKLGKSLFWDMQSGSDGRTACATCHFNAGADNRSTNQINPRGGSFTLHGPNADLNASDFPFRKLADVNDAASAVVSDTKNVAGSQGVLPSAFDGIAEGSPFDLQTYAPTDPDFQVNGVNVRRSTGRNTPSAINAVFNFRNFWDGRAQNEFNGVNPFGNRDVSATVGRVAGGGTVEQVKLEGPLSLTNSSLASQAVGPPGNPVEMSSNGRSLADIGKKLLALRPLDHQAVSSDDSVLGGLVADGGKGLSTNYAAMIRDAFQSDWWDSPQELPAGGRTYSLMQYNFPLFWGLAIQAYESTLVSDQTPVDQFVAGNAGAMSADAQAGLGIFQGGGGCTECHGDAALTAASVSSVAEHGVSSLDDTKQHDTGFFNIGSRATDDDNGQAGTDPFGGPLAVTGAPSATNEVAGAFKAPSLRNVALTAPYFHNGGQATLRQVVDFYSRGGDFANAEKSTNMSALGLSDVKKDQLVAFLNALTDPRVETQSAPFDHPQLFVPVGEQRSGGNSVQTGADGRAVDCFRDVPATGASGGQPLPRFPGFKGGPCVDLTAAPAAGPGPGPGPNPGPAGGGAAAPLAGPTGTASGGLLNTPAATVAKLRLSSLRTAGRVKRASARSRGLRVSVKLPAGVKVLQFKVYRVTGSGRTLVGTVTRHPAAAGAYGTVLNASGLRRKLTVGRYQLVATPGASASSLGTASTASLRIIG